MTDTLSATRRDVLAACLDYEWATDHNGPEPLAAGARLRILAKRYAKAYREANPTPVTAGGTVAAQGRHAE